MTDKEKIANLQHRVKELESAVKSLIKTLEMHHNIMESQMMLNNESTVFIIELEGVYLPPTVTTITM
jgi:hypothetical protein